MPLIYSHLRFGKKCLNSLPDEYIKLVNNNLTYFNFGTLGPNILLYHSPFTSSKYRNKSKEIHQNQIALSLKRIKQIFLTNKDRDAILSYTLGYISHFLLDSYCDCYIDISAKELNISNNKLKTELERYYLAKDNILKLEILLNDFKTNSNTNKIISLILNEKESEIKQSSSNFISYYKILSINNKYILSFINKLLTILKHKDYSDLFLYNACNKHTAQIIRTEKYFEIAILHYKILISNLLDYLFEDKELNEYYFNSFYNNKNEIKVLSIDEEKKYIINDFMK